MHPAGVHRRWCPCSESDAHRARWNVVAGSEAGRGLTKAWEILPLRRTKAGASYAPHARRAEAAQEGCGGQPASSPCALVPHELIHPLVPLARLVSSSRFGKAARPRVRARGIRRRKEVMGESLPTDRGTCPVHYTRRNKPPSSRRGAGSRLEEEGGCPAIRRRSLR